MRDEQLDHIAMPCAYGVMEGHRPRFIAGLEDQTIPDLSLFVVLRMPGVGKGWVFLQE